MSKPNPNSHEIEITRDIEYGTARIDYNGGDGPMRTRALLLDLYRPLDAHAALPTLVLAFGGAFHRGSKENDVRPEDGPKNTAIAEYCARFARRGYLCCSIDYRLTPEDPDPGSTPTLGDEPVPTSRIDVVRELLGLPPATSEMLKCAQEAAIDDIVSAFRFVVADAAALGADPSRVAIGGFSAGARMAATAALAERISPAAVVAMSGVAAPSIIDRFHASGRPHMPIFLAYGENDLDYVIPGARSMLERLTAASHPHESAFLPGQTHFYPASAAVVASHAAPTSLEEAMAGFLARHLQG
ncbi:MAG: acetyl esterase/lipase [Gammaproteobacteria bacterium]|jgi:acetyl esterase/lipase